MATGIHENRQSKTVTALSIFAKASISAGLLLVATQLAAKKRRRVGFRDKVVLITGSRGLGLALAREFGQRGARIALSARSADELNSACKILLSQNIECATFPADISDPLQVVPLVDRVRDHYGRIDVLVNNAGEIRVAPFENFERADYEDAMNLMFWAAVNLTFAVLPGMKAQGGGHIVNITSIGGRISIPHLLPYSCAKFAFVGFSTGIGTELRAHGIRVLTAVPGLMRTGSYVKARFKGDANREFVWFGLLGNMPGFSVAAEYAARSVRYALEKRRRICTISLPARILNASAALAPETTHLGLELTNRFLLPGPNTSKDLCEGSALPANSNKIYRAFTMLGRRAASNFNEQ